MTLSAIHNERARPLFPRPVVCDIGGYDFVSYSQLALYNGIQTVGCL